MAPGFYQQTLYNVDYITLDQLDYSHRHYCVICDRETIAWMHTNRG